MNSRAQVSRGKPYISQAQKKAPNGHTSQNTGVRKGRGISGWVKRNTKMPTQTIRNASSVPMDTSSPSRPMGNSPAINNGTLNFYRLSSIAVATPYSGNGAFNFLGTGLGGQSAYSLNATNTFTGPVTVTKARLQSGAGALSFGSPSSIGISAGSQVYAVAQPYSPVFNIPLTLAGSGWMDGLGALRIMGIMQGHVGTAAGELEGDLPSDAGAGAGDEHPFAIHS